MGLLTQFVAAISSLIIPYILLCSLFLNVPVYALSLLWVI